MLRLKNLQLRMCPENGNSQKWLGEGAKGLLGPGREKHFALVQNGVAPVQKQVSDGPRDSWETFACWAQKTFSTLPLALLGIHNFQLCPRTFGLQTYLGKTMREMVEPSAGVGHFVQGLGDRLRCIGAPRPSFCTRHFAK